MYKCNQCQSVHTNREWDAATRIRFGNDIVRIGEKGDMEHSSFQCPSCGELSEGNELTELRKRPKVHEEGEEI